MYYSGGARHFQSFHNSARSPILTLSPDQVSTSSSREIAFARSYRAFFIFAAAWVDGSLHFNRAHLARGSHCLVSRNRNSLEFATLHNSSRGSAARAPVSYPA